MTTQLIPLKDLDPRDLARWHELAEVALEPNPFFEQEYLLPLARALGQLAEVALAVVTKGAAWIACMPVRRAGGWHRIPLPAMSVWRGTEVLPTLIGTPLLSRAHAPDAAVALVAFVGRSPGTFFTAFDWLVEGGPVYHAMCEGMAEAGLRALRFEHFARAFLTRRPENDYLERAMKAKRRAQLRGRWRKLCEALGEEPEIVDRAGEQAAVTQLIDLEGRSRLAERGQVLSVDPLRVRFFSEMCAAFAARGRLQLLALQTRDRTVAMKCNLLADPGIFYFKVAYDESYAEFSPGIQLEAAMFASFQERSQATWIDSCADQNNETTNRLLLDRRSLVTLTTVDPTLRALAAVPAIRGARYVRERMIAAHTDSAT